MSKCSVARLALAHVACLGVIAHGIAIAAPVVTPCTSYLIAPASVSPGPTAGSQVVTITGSPAGCTGTLTATSNDSWLGLSVPGGDGSGSVTVSWPLNPLPAPRTGTVTIASQTFTVTQGAAALPPGTYFSDNFEGGGGNWLYQAPWAVTTETALSGTHSLSDSPGGNYGPNVNVTVFSVPIDLRSAVDPQVRFWQGISFPADGLDSGNVWVSRDDSSPLEFLQRYWGVTPGWTETILDLTPYKGLQSVRLYFQVLTNGSVSADGWHIDDVVVKEAPPCTGFTIAPSSASPGATAGSQIVSVLGVPVGCKGNNWAAAGDGAWLSVLPTAGTGPGTVTVSWTQNPTRLPRSSSASIAGFTFSVTQAPPPADPKNDFNRDGWMDLVFRHLTSGDLVIWFMNGTARTSSQYLNPFHVGANWRLAGTGDFNGDGKPDILWQEKTAGDLVVWFMDGINRTSFSYLSIIRPADPAWKVAAVADMNGDTKPDLVWQHAMNGQLAAWMLDGTNVTSRVSLNPWSVLDNDWKIVNTGDFNGDGKTDLLWKHSVDGFLIVWMMDGVNRTSVEWLSPYKLLDVAWEVVAAGDIDGDHKVDLVFQHPTDGRLVAWYLNGVSRIAAQMLTPDHVLDPMWRIAAPK